uniref:Auxilin-like protein 1 isoform X1 n=1 Tax=Elaeis guineensis var. tenera TaxID=51953 RepID=A0A6I9RDN3_ELAGV|nr:auxilin-like protein 1 isoform X1 [Elaeis guineensis]
MEELPASRIGGTATSKKAARAASKKAAAAAKSAYDDVFGGPPRYAVPFAARLDDYSEIFGGLAGSCFIPVLDLPPTMDGLDDAPVDAWRSGFDYAEIFRGFDGGEFVVSYQELFAEPNKEEVSFSDERGQRRTGFGPQMTEVSKFPPKHPKGDNVACTEEDQFSSNSNHPDDGLKQLKVLYNKTSRGNIEDAISGRTHVTQLHAVPGFAVVVDGCNPLENNVSNNPPDMVNGELADLDQGKKVPPTSSADNTKSTGSDLKADQKLHATKFSASQSGHAKAKHHSCSSSNQSTCTVDVSSADALYVSVSDISLQTQPLQVPPPSRPPPKLFNKQGLCSIETYANARTDLDEVKLCKPIASHQTRYGVASSKDHAHQESVKGSSPFFDAEVDASSAAAASAAAMKEAMELAQGRLKSAKESMERKRDNLQSRRLGHYDVVKCNGRKGDHSTQEVESFNEERTRKTLVKQGKKIDGIASEERHEVISETKKTLDYEEKEGHVLSAEEDQRSIQGNSFKFSEVSHKLEKNSGKWKTDKEFYELINDEKNDKMVREVFDQNIIVKNTKKTAMISEDKENVNKDAGQAYECKGIGKLREGAGNSERAENTMKLKDGNIACREEEIKEVPDMIPEACVHEESANILEDDQDPDEEENENLRKIQKASVHGEDVKKRFTSDEAPACEESEKTLKPLDDACKLEENYASGNEKRKLEAANEACESEDNEEKFGTTDVTCVPSEHEDNLNVDSRTGIRDEIEKEIKVPHGSCMWEGDNLEAPQAASQCENSGKERIKGNVECYHAENEHRSEDTWVLHELEESKRVNVTQEACLQVKDELKLKVNPEADELEGDLKEQKTAIGAMEHGEQEKKTGSAKEACCQDFNEMKMVDAQLEFVQKDKQQEGDQAPLQLGNEQTVFVSDHGEERSKDVKEFHVASDIIEEVKKLNGIREIFQRAAGRVMEDVWQASLLAKNGEIPNSAQDDMESSALASDRTTEDVRQASLLAKNGEIPNSAQDDMESSALASDRTTEDVRQAEKLAEKDKMPSSAPDAMESSALASDRTANNLHRTEGRKNERRIERETDQVKEQARNFKEQKEREREREKDRFAVERATHEAQERTFAEARERAERIAVERVIAEARLRALAEAREKAENASREAQERSLAEKALREARLRVERAAMERATAEARERAVERALAEKAASEARERMERFNATSRNKMRKDNVAEDHFKTRDKDMQDVAHSAQFQRSSSGSCQIYSDFNGQGEGESNLRYKARLERHQRTVERAVCEAKALAEKNRRDLLSQREQAERHRLAEYLDAEVKRWSNGKEGNLRALLSTLQYILGPESGWQPIPLTDILTAPAVKKAYRKATLCVHPDKLQQRGASIQQKYVCEKVFDLLKEAWNRFNSEER